MFLGEKILWRYETRYRGEILAILAKTVLVKELVILYSPLARKEGKLPAVYVTMEVAISQPDATGRER